MTPDEYARHDATALAALVKAGEVSPRALVDAALERVRSLDPKLGAIVHLMPERARAEADRPRGDGPFAGVPLLVKDLLCNVQGEPTASGMRLKKGWVAPRDSEVVRRLKAAGFVIIGKTASSELGLLPVTEPLAHGPCRNPWDPARTPGGSSGGSAAAVAARMVPVASGGDGGGSIRIPAACCGLFGLKPSRGRVPAGPDESVLWMGCVSEHALTRTVRDSAAVLDALAGPDPGAPWAAPPPARPFRDEVEADPGRLRIAWTTRPLVPARVDPECVVAVEQAAKLLAELGHQVEEAHPPIEGAPFARDFLTMLMAETAADVREAEALVHRRASQGTIEPGTALLAALGQRRSAEELALAQRRLHRLGRAVAPFFERFDVLVTPTLARPPVALGAFAPTGAESALLGVLTHLGGGRGVGLLGVLERLEQSAWDFTPFTAPWNVTGQPAMSVPLAWSEPPGAPYASASGRPPLPIGVQFVGRPWGEATLLRLAGQLERARPWADRRPPIS